MGVAMREDGGTLGVFSPKKVGAGPRPAGWPMAPLQALLSGKRTQTVCPGPGAALTTARPSLHGRPCPTSSPPGVPVAWGH